MSRRVNTFHNPLHFSGSVRDGFNCDSSHLATAAVLRSVSRYARVCRSVGRPTHSVSHRVLGHACQLALAVRDILSSDAIAHVTQSGEYGVIQTGYCGSFCTKPRINCLVMLGDPVWGMPLNFTSFGVPLIECDARQMLARLNALCRGCDYPVVAASVHLRT